MNKRVFAAAALLLFALPLHADFASIARAIDAKPGVERVWMPFMGLARMIVWIAEPKGAHDFQIATFSGTDRLDPREMEALVRNGVGKGFQPLVQSRSRRSGESSFIYVRPHDKGEMIEMIIFAHDKEETVLIRVDVEADVVARDLEISGRVTTVAQR